MSGSKDRRGLGIVRQFLLADQRGKLEPAEFFHEVLVHRWFLSEQAGRDIGTTAAARDYIDRVLPNVPDELVAGPPTDQDVF